MFLIVYCTIAIAAFLWLFGFVKAALTVVLVTLAFMAYSFIRRQITRKRYLNNKTHQ